MIARKLDGLPYYSLVRFIFLAFFSLIAALPIFGCRSNASRSSFDASSHVFSCLKRLSAHVKLFAQNMQIKQAVFRCFCIPDGRVNETVQPSARQGKRVKWSRDMCVDIREMSRYLMVQVERGHLCSSGAIL